MHDDVISHVNITNVKSEDGGEYTCTAHNGMGRAAHSARVNVYGLPFIRQMPKLTAIAGHDLLIKCPAAGYPIESVIWERDGQQLPVNRRQRVYANGTLVVEQAQRREDAGTYTCQASNKQRNTSRRDVELQILGKQPHHRPSIIDRQQSINHSVQFRPRSCRCNRWRTCCARA